MSYNPFGVLGGGGSGGGGGGGGTPRLVGEVVPYAGAVAPDGWLFANGLDVSRDTYATLFALIGTTYGPGDASTTFNLPNFCGRVPTGKADMGGASVQGITTNPNAQTLGALMGSEGAYVNAQNLGAGGNHFHDIVYDKVSVSQLSSEVDVVVTIGTGPSTAVTADKSAFDTTGGTPLELLQPLQIINFIIKY